MRVGAAGGHDEPGDAREPRERGHDILGALVLGKDDFREARADLALYVEGGGLARVERKDAQRLQRALDARVARRDRSQELGEPGLERHRGGSMPTSSSGRAVPAVLPRRYPSRSRATWRKPSR